MSLTWPELQLKLRDSSVILTGMQLKDAVQNKNVIVTGGAGFIGSYLCEELLRNGARVTAIDNLLTGNKKNIKHFLQDKNFTFLQADVTQATERYWPSGLEPDILLHFASPASPPRYQQHPIETYLASSVAVHNILQFLLKNHPQCRFLFASTSEIYGDPLEHPQKESYWGNVNPNGIRSCYDEAKRLGETICGVHFRDFHLDVRIVRIFNTYGPRMDIDDGRVIPDFIKQCLKNQPLNVYGKGNQTRSYCYVTDLVDGVLRFAAAENGAGETVNLGNPGEYTVLQTAEVIQKITGTKLPLEFKPLPIDDPTRRQPDISKAKKLLDWEPKISFEDGLKPTIEYFRQSIL